MVARTIALLVLQLCTGLLAPARRIRAPQALQAAADDATVLWLHGDGVSNVYGASSPRPSPAHAVVAAQLARRVGHFDAKVRGTTDAAGDVVIGLRRDGRLRKRRRRWRGSSRPASWPTTSARRTSRSWRSARMDAVAASLDKLQKALPFTTKASRARLLAQSELLLARGSSEDALFAALFLVERLVRRSASSRRTSILRGRRIW